MGGRQVHGPEESPVGLVQTHFVPQVSPPELDILLVLGISQQELELVYQIEQPLPLFRGNGAPGVFQQLYGTRVVLGSRVETKVQMLEAQKLVGLRARMTQYRDINNRIIAAGAPKEQVAKLVANNIEIERFLSLIGEGDAQSGKKTKTGVSWRVVN